MRQTQPAPKNASANRIRERYLHQLGLQRGSGLPPFSADSHNYRLEETNHVVVISGLPSLPEDRPSTAMESHDYSISKHTHHSITTPGSGVDENSNYDEGDGVVMMDSGNTHKAHATPTPPHQNTAMRGGESLLHMALAYPTTVLMVPPPPSAGRKKPAPPPTPVVSRPVPYRNTLPSSAFAMLDLADGGDSVSSACTSTTTESSVIVSRDCWGGVRPHSAAGEDSTWNSARPLMLLSGNSHHGGGGLGWTRHNCPTTSSLASDLHRFNIDSDCEASEMSNSIATEDHRAMNSHDGEDASVDDGGDTVVSRRSVMSNSSSAKSHRGGSSRKNKLMVRAVAHERILRIRSDQSMKMRADVVHAQRGVGGQYPLVMPHEQQPKLPPPESLCVTGTNMSTVQLVHVDHGSGRTPIASNCSDLQSNLRKLRDIERSYYFVPEGVHIAPSPSCTGMNSLSTITHSTGITRPMRPLSPHPHLVSCLPPPPPPHKMELQCRVHTVTSNNSTCSDRQFQYLINNNGPTPTNLDANEHHMWQPPVVYQDDTSQLNVKSHSISAIPTSSVPWSSAPVTPMPSLPATVPSDGGADTTTPHPSFLSHYNYQKATPPLPNNVLPPQRTPSIDDVMEVALSLAGMKSGKCPLSMDELHCGEMYKYPQKT